MKAVDHFRRYWWFYVALALIVLFALYYRAGVPGHAGAISDFVIPTWGNTMYHVGVERVTLDTGHYPSEEISYGGGFPNFYVPGYRLLVVALSAATGIDPMPMSGLVVLLLGAVLPAGGLHRRLPHERRQLLRGPVRRVLLPDVPGHDDQHGAAVPRADGPVHPADGAVLRVAGGLAAGHAHGDHSWP